MIESIRRELLLLRRDRAAWLLFALLFIATAAAMANGLHSELAARAIAHSLAEDDQKRAPAAAAKAQALAASNSTVSPFRDPRNADAVGRRLVIRHATLPATALAPLSIGQGDLLTRHYPVSLEPRDALLANDGFAAPRLLQAGRFDLTFIVVVLGPLFVIGLCHGVLTTERDQGLLRMMLVQRPALARWLCGRFAARLMLVSIPIVAAALLLVIGAPSLPTALRAALWLATALAYVAAWIALAWWVATWRISAPNATLGLAAVWLALVIVAPAVLSVALDLRHPAPPRIGYVDAMRNATDVARADGSRVLARYLEDHPELGQTVGPLHLHPLEVTYTAGTTYTALGPYRSGLVVVYTVPVVALESLLSPNASASDIEAAIARGFVVFDGTGPCALATLTATDYPEIDAMQFRLDYHCPALRRLAIDYRLFASDTHENQLDLWLDGERSSAVLRGTRRAFEIPLGRMLRASGALLPEQPPMLPGERGQALSGDADFFALRFAVQQQVERSLEPLMQSFEQRREAHRRWASAARWLSPALLAASGLTDAAGTGEPRHRQFVTQVTAFHGTWREFFEPYIVAGQPFDAFDQLPAFAYQEESSADLLRRSTAAAGSLMLLALTMVVLAMYRSNRLSPD